MCFSLSTLHNAHNTSELQSGPFERLSKVLHCKLLVVLKVLAPVDIAGRQTLRLS